MSKDLYGKKRNAVSSANKVLLIASIVCVVAAIIVFVFFTKHMSRKNQNINYPSDSTNNVLSSPPATSELVPSPTPDEEADPIVPSEMTVSARFNPPRGYTRVALSNGSFGEYLRNFSLHEYNTKPLVYDSETKALVNDDTAPAISVLKLDLINKGNLQTGAASVIRLYGEYLYSQGRYSDISFNLLTTPAFACDFQTWSEGGRLLIKEDNVITWCKEHSEDVCNHKDVTLGTAPGTFRYYLQNVMLYSNHASLVTNMSKVAVSDIMPGDVILYSDSNIPEIVVDVASDSSNNKVYMVARGGSPASEIYIVRNESDADINPWRNLRDLQSGAAVYRFTK